MRSQSSPFCESDRTSDTDFNREDYIDSLCVANHALRWTGASPAIASTAGIIPVMMPKSNRSWFFRRPLSSRRSY